MSELRILLIKTGGDWVAQCLEYDIAAQGDTIKNALKAFDETFAAELMYSASKEQDPLSGIDPAPKYYWKVFAVVIKRFHVMLNGEMK